MLKHSFLILALLCLISCATDDSKGDSFVLVSDCGTNASPYMLQDVSSNDTLIYRLDYWFWHDDTNQTELLVAGQDIKYLNSAFSVAAIQFKLGDVKVVPDRVKAENPKDYLRHGWEVEEWYYENRHTDSYSLFRMVYPYTSNSPPGAALDIPSVGDKVQYPFLGTTTSIHEMGHVFGLYHTHQNDDSDGRNYVKGDRCCDLPYHPPLLTKDGVPLDQNCKDIREKFQKLTKEEAEALSTNWMTYVRYVCREEFTQDQIDRMRWVATNSPAHIKARVY